MITSNEAHPDAVVETPLHPLHLDPGALEVVDDLLGNLWASPVRVLILVVVRWEVVKVVDDACVLGHVDAHPAGPILPVGREDDHSLGLDLGRDLASSLTQLAEGRVLSILHEVGPADSQEVDGRSLMLDRGGFRHVDWRLGVCHISSVGFFREDFPRVQTCQ